MNYLSQLYKEIKPKGLLIVLEQINVHNFSPILNIHLIWTISSPIRRWVELVITIDNRSNNIDVRDRGVNKILFRWFSVGGNWVIFSADVDYRITRRDIVLFITDICNDAFNKTPKKCTLLDILFLLELPSLDRKVIDLLAKPVKDEHVHARDVHARDVHARACRKCAKRGWSWNACPVVDWEERGLWHCLCLLPILFQNRDLQVCCQYRRHCGFKESR